MMKRKIVAFLTLLLAVIYVADAENFPSKGKVLHYRFKERYITFEGRKDARDRGVLHCYDLKQGKMWDVGNPWDSKFSDDKGMPLDSNYIFDLDISAKKLGPKQTYIINFNCRQLDDSEGPFWLCRHDQPEVGYYPFRTEADHAIIFTGKPNPDSQETLCQWYRIWGKPDVYTTIVMLVDRTDGKHTLYVCDSGYYYYVDEARKDVADYDRLVLRRLAKGGIAEIAVYNRHLSVREIEEFYRGTNAKSFLPDPVPIIDDAENGMYQKKFGLRGWTSNYLFQSWLCLGLRALSLILNLFFRQGPFAYRGKGWVVFIMIISFVFLQIFYKSPFGGIHLMEIIVLVSYIVVSVGPVEPNYEGNGKSSFIAALLAAFGFSGIFLGSFLGSMLSSLASGPITRTSTTKVTKGGRTYTTSSENVTPVLGATISSVVIYAGIAFGLMWTLSNLVVGFMNIFVIIRFIRNCHRGTSE